MARSARSAATTIEGDSSDSDAGPSSSKNGSLSTFVNATTTLKSKRRRIARRNTGALGNEDAWNPPLEAFTALPQYEATDRPRKVRRAAYLDARRWLYDVAARVQDECNEPQLVEVVQSIRRVQDRLSDQTSSSALRPGIPVIDVSLGVPNAHLWSHLEHSRSGKSNGNASSPWHIHVAADSLTQEPKQLIAAACRHWLVDAFDDSPQPSLGCTALWTRLVTKVAALDQSAPLFILGLSGLPRSQLFSTLSFLRDSCEHAPQLLVILRSQPGTGRASNLPWEERRHLDVLNVNGVGSSDLRHQPSLVHRLFLDPTNPSPIHLPPQVLHLASSQAGHGGDDRASVLAVIDLALQNIYAQNPAGCFLGAQPQLRVPDFTSVFFEEARQSIMQLLHLNGEGNEPDISMLPTSLQSSDAVRQLLQDDERLLAALPLLVNTSRTSLQDRSMALEMLERASQSSADQSFQKALGSLSVLLLTTSADDLGKGAQLRKQLNDIIGPILRGVRRNESEEGGLTLTQLEQWLDSLEEWIDGASAFRESCDGDFLTSSLHKIRAFQQELRNAQIDAEHEVREAADGLNGTSESSRLSQVDRKLQRDESLRGLRSKIADWFSSAIKTQVLQPVPDLMFTTATTGIDLAIAVESLLFPSPRQHITVALSRPHLILQHFRDAIQTTDKDQQPLDAKTQAALKSLEASLRRKKKPTTLHELSNELQTDLSRAFEMLREAGGPGTGVKGRMINLYDWYRAWLQDEEDKTAQARFSLVLSTLSMMGYIRKTRKGNGTLVLKTGGWDVMPWSTQGQDGAPDKQGDVDDVF